MAKRRIFCYSAFISIAFIFCSYTPAEVSFVKNMGNCRLFENEIYVDEILPSTNTAVIAALNDFNKDNSFLQVLYFYGKSGSPDFNLEKWNFLKETCKYTLISGNKVSEKNIKPDRSFHYTSEASKSYIKDCGYCFDCSYGLLVIKSENVVFKYYFVGQMNGVDPNDLYKIAQGITLLDKLKKM